MTDLSSEQRELVTSLAAELREIRGVRAVVLGGSYARGRARQGSDIDLALFYAEGSPFSIASVRELAYRVNDTPKPIVADFYEWGPWVNGGSWLTIRGQRVDFLYRSIEQVERVIGDAEAGRHELHYGQQGPFGFFSATYLGEVKVCVPLFDPEALLPPLKLRVRNYPEALRRSIVQSYLVAVEFELDAAGPKIIAREDPYLMAACLTRAVNHLVLVLFALNRSYPLNDKTALLEIAEFDRAPKDFGARVRGALAHVGSTASELTRAFEVVRKLAHETVELSDGLYQPRYA